MCSSDLELITKYLSGSIINTEYLNIEYSSGSTYIWDNFVHFSSAKERVDNFVYKVKLIELYESNINSASYDPSNLGYSGSVSALQQINNNTIKKNQIIQSFDGFETFLYTSSSLTNSGSNSITWPYSGSIRLSVTNTGSVLPWYSNLLDVAENYDIENTNYLKNNI